MTATNPRSASPWSVERTADWLADRVLRETGVNAEDLDRDMTFSAIGLGSTAVTALIAELSRQTGRPIPVTAAWTFPTVNGLALAVVSGETESLKNAVGSEDRIRHTDTVRGGSDEPLAVVSMAVRLPGADTLAELWKQVLDGAEAIGPPPANRFGENPGTLPDAGYLRQPLDEFDHGFFHLTPRETAALDPVQRLFMEVCWEAIEASTLLRTGLRGSATGVYAGSIWNEHGAAGRPGQHTLHTATGSSLSMVANRISYLYDLRGPSVTLDSACSSSLVAVHLAAQALRAGEIDVALVGGVNLLQSAATTEDLTAFGGLAPDGRSKAFSAGADGFGRGEGAVALILKRRSHAERDGDHIWCLLHGTAVNNDGHTNGLTAPSPTAQQAVVRQAHARGGTDPSQVRFVETHGTGTSLGDPIEATALAGALGARSAPVHLGTLKANIGHLEGAAGAAGLVKAALVMYHRTVPPCRLTGGTNPHIDLDALGLDIPAAPVRLPRGETFLGGVSGFGWGGTNAHAVVAPYSEPKHQQAVTGAGKAEPAVKGARTFFAFTPFGGQWPGMGRDLLRSDAEFRAAIVECDRGSTPVLGRSVLDLLATGADPDAEGVAVSQCAVYAVQVGLVRSLATRGVRPAVVAGHSLGEIAGAVAVDAITAVEGGRIVAHYATAQQRLTGRGGGMAVVPLPSAELADHLKDYPNLVVAGRSSKRSTNLSGPTAELDELVAKLVHDGHRASRINVDLAAHSPAIDEVRGDLIRDIGHVDQYPPALPMVSALDGRVMGVGDFDAGYFATGLRQPVDFAGALEHPLIGDSQAVIEINAHPILGSSLKEHFGERAQVLSSNSRSGHALDQVVAALAGVHNGVGESEDAAGPTASRRDEDAPADSAADRSVLLTLSAHTPAALARRCRDAASWWDEDLSPDAAASALTGFGTLPYRAGIVAVEREAAVQRLLEHSQTLDDVRQTVRRPGASGPRVAFVFPGQGGQWRGMGRDLYRRDTVFARHLRRCDAVMAEAGGAEVLRPLLEGGDDAFINVATAQPLLFAMQVSLARTLEHYGVTPHAVVGHSMGEAAAAHLAGAISLHDAAAVIGRRSRLMDSLTGTGAMLATELSLAEAEHLCAGTPTVSVAVSNSARSTVLSGAKEDIGRLAAELTGRGIFNRLVRVQVASHSPQMDAILPPLREVLSDVRPTESRLPLYSTVLGRVANGTELTADYWACNLRDPVLFGTATEQLLGDGFDCFVEISPHPVLSPSVEETAAEHGGAVVVPALRREQPEWPTLLSALGRLYEAGVPVRAEDVNPPTRATPPPLPFPWQRVSTPVLGGVTNRGRTNPVGVRTQLPHDPDVSVYAGRLDTGTWSLADHVVEGQVILPAAAFVALAACVSAEAAHSPQTQRASRGSGVEAPWTVRDLALPRSLPLGPGETTLQTTVRAGSASPSVGETEVTFHGRDGQTWTQVATARVAPCPGGDTQDAVDAWATAFPSDDGTDAGDADHVQDFYRSCAARGLEFGQQYRLIGRLSVTAAGAAADLDVDPRRADSRLPVDPRLLDAVFQVAAAPLLTGPGALPPDRTVLTTAVREVTLYAPVGTDAHVVTSLTAEPGGETYAADAVVRSEGRVALRVQGMRIRHLPAAATGSASGAPSLRSELTELPAHHRAARIAEVVRKTVGEVAGVSTSEVDPAEPFRDIGLNSIMGLELRRRLEVLFGLRLSSTVIWNHPTADALSAELERRLAEEATPAGPAEAAGQAARPGAESGPVPQAHDADADASEATGAAGPDAELAALQRELRELEAMVGEL
ncbi:acyltransferase domain-containing protein [Streptomyces sp. MBT56]|uniref:type I polyketide synthase n=1 Tax=unclassified Streptomyces TaxID=2593676 RepID=UPI001909B60F|nr:MULTISPECIES: type I polyketide synthase [unclassified Streptomyces]MBK3554995.1 acyltransferase domain-containing protein [Streptomyces sp. MBT56]MBK3601199.1 acyltransferase domain-containing protein [Streptomyces sp. MBT54]MBK3615049.1 acyltransferase domain-containing protein [Streptomyces sp. MBT98]